MAVLVMVSGGNGSGKSRFAEQLIAQTEGRRYYIATMKPCTQENHQRIEKHRRQREGLEFQTLELPYQVQAAPVTADGVVLLEDVSNLLANVMFEKSGDADHVFQDICGLMARCRILVAVTISGLCADGYDEGTTAYINGLNELNQRLHELATVAVTMEDQHPIYEKGDTYDLA